MKHIQQSQALKKLEQGNSDSENPRADTAQLAAKLIADSNCQYFVDTRSVFPYNQKAKLSEG